MPKTHNPILAMTAAFALATLVAAAPALAQAAAQPPSQPAKPPMQAEKAPATTLQGDLLSVDPEAKTVTIKPATGADQVFKYAEDTKVIGGDKGVAGLATMKGSKVTVTFKTEGRDRIATQIEVHPKAGG
jgi:hypothetical protein